MSTETPAIFDSSISPQIEHKRGLLAATFNLVFVIDRSQARIFATNPFQREDTVVNSLGREKNRVMRNDRPDIGDNSDPHEDAAIQFARLLGHQIVHRLNLNHELRILIVCEARMHGYLNRFVDNERVTWYSSNLSHFSENDILKHLLAHRERFDPMALQH